MTPPPRVVAASWAFACAAAITAPAGAQAITPFPAFPATEPTAASAWDVAAPAESPSTSWRAPIASAIVPGAGQWMLGQRRWLAYLAVEAVAVAYHLERKGRGGSLRTAYRDLAWTVARFGTTGSRMDGDFDYYERLSNFRTSGRFDVDSGRPGVQPETDVSTYNGRIWQLARGLFLGGNAQPQPGDPGWDAALAYYSDRSYPDAFYWDWTGKEAALEEFRRTLGDSDAAFRRATTVLGVIIANHLVSSVDALLGVSGDLSERLDVTVAPHAAEPRAGWVIELSVRR